MKLTEFFRLRMPDGTDPVNIEDFNDNFEVIDKELKKRISSGESASDVTVEFEAAESRQPLKSGEKLSVLMGKAHRFFTDLKTVAFSGKYGDLSERPTLGGAAGYKVADNDTTNNSEFLATARVAYEHGLEIDALSRDLNAINDNGAIKGMDAREDGVYITYVPSSGADSVTKKLGSEPQLLGTLTGNGTFDCKKIANYKQLTKDNFFIIPKTVRARFNAPGGTDSSNMGWNSTKELKSIEYNADTGILSFYLTTSDSYSYGSYWTKSYSIDITGDLYCVF
jgi:hypothetical protein